MDGAPNGRVTSSVQRPSDSAAAFAPTAAGLVAWAGAFLLLPVPLAARIFLLAPLVVVPRIVALLPDRAWLATLGAWPLLAAALPLIAAFSIPAGAVASAFTVPWLLCAVAGAAAAIRHGIARWPTILARRHLADLGVDAALAFWAVGAAFTLIERLGLETGFPPAIVLLTATHFHFAGLGLLAIASLVARQRRWLSDSVGGLIVGIPLTALGFVTTSTAIGALGASIVGISGIGVGVALLAADGPGRRALERIAGAALLVGMPMAIAWSLSIALGVSFLDLETMVRTHGALNATAVLLGAIAMTRNRDRSQAHAGAGSIPDTARPVPAR